MIKILISILSSVLVISLSCKGTNTSMYQKDTAIQSFDSCILFIHSPYNCYYKFKLNGNAFGNLKVYINKQVSNDLESDSLINSFVFKIAPLSDMLSINKIIQEIKTNDKVKSPRMFDAYGFELTVDKEKYIDVYGQNEKIDDLLKVLSKYIKEENDRCGFFRLFKQTLQNP